VSEYHSEWNTTGSSRGSATEEELSDDAYRHHAIGRPRNLILGFP
jgi:hypothetical protein